MKTTITIERDDQEIEVGITGRYTPPCKGGRDRHGFQSEPDDPAEMEIEDAKVVETGADIELTDKEMDQAEEALWEQLEDARTDYIVARAAARREDWR